MAWFKLNDSLNTLKGQISNVSNVVQEVFSEAIIDENSAEPVAKLEDAVKEIDHLTNLCNTKDNELTALRRQILELQQQKNAENTTGSALVKSNADQNAPPIEDSWFWDPEPNTASSSSKDHSSKSGSGGDLTIIPLDNQRSSSETIEKLRSAIDDKDRQLEKVKIENAILNEKINQLSNENRELNTNIDELDRQHETATERLIDMKDQIEQKWNAAQKELEIAKLDGSKLNKLLADYEDLTGKYANVEKSYISGMEENLGLKNQIQELSAELEKLVSKNMELMSSSDEREKEIIDKLGFVDIEKEKDQLADVENYKLQIAELNNQIKELDDLKVQHQKTIDELKASKANLSSMMEELAQLNSTISNKESALMERDSDIEQLKKKYDHLETSFNEFQEDALIKEMELGKEKNSLEDKLSSLDATYQSLLTELENSKSQQKESNDKYVLQTEFDNLKAKASDSETKLVEENVVLQKEILDLQTCIQNHSQGANVINIEDLRSLIKKYINYDVTLDGSMNSLEEFFQGIGDSFSTLDTIEKNLNGMTDELKIVLAEKKRVEHEKETIKADLHHYEIEVGELMKSNEVLLTEIEHLKSGKLETISEHNEDSIISLEKQLEDCSNLNQSLEDEYQEIRDRLEEVENAKEMLEQKLEKLTEELQSEREASKDLTSKLENLDAERSNLLFEINELKAEDSLNVLEQSIADKDRAIEALERQFKTLNQDHTELIAKLQSLQTQSLEMKSNLQSQIAELQNGLVAKDELITKKEQDVLELIGEIRGLKKENAERSETQAIDERQQQETEGLITKLKNLEMELSKIQEECVAKQTEVDSLQLSVASSQADNENLLAKIQHLNEKLTSAEEHTTTNQSLDTISMENESLKVALESLSKEKNDLIALITAKHNENVQYHAEIQRLSQLLSVEVEKHRECINCAELSKQLNELKANNQNVEKLNDQVTFLREKSDILTQNLVTEQMNQKLLNQERSELIEEKNGLAKDLDRLRQHLLEVEETHMAETVELQQIISETKSKMSVLEEEAKKSSNAYTSASIRANQHTETLQTQYQLLTQQRDELLAKLSAAEDKESRNEAALINLQCALEQFQNNKERDVESVTYRLRKDLENEAKRQIELQNEIKSLHNQLTESKNGLLAASRITDQLESCQVANATLKTELRDCNDKMALMEKKLMESESCHADKIEKGLLKNLLIGYIVAPNQNDKLQILKLISSVLSFDQSETDKVGLNKTHTSWLNSLLAGTGGGSTENENYNAKGLGEAFVKFLEKESQPRANTANSMSLLNIVQKPLTKPVSSEMSSAHVSPLPPVSQPSTTAAAATTTATVPAPIQPILLTDSIMQNFAPPRNSSSILKDILNDS
ncbi:putative leucine-rich repeat-containing protein DDB_G0290503 isoform X2 [Bradysia coprophila]|uniref:putative leucine-rich repeat-containing protein DDB_G0290503 isoform X2 n=1 Tax=Bradysia coprophila TaxID=38358 RepID=UPI00187D77B8|nr:putative leucine-rich repeat-containing protein DDB_G0290503 isoform X2 [Bradysia coprophila]